MLWANLLPLIKTHREINFLPNFLDFFKSTLLFFLVKMVFDHQRALAGSVLQKEEWQEMLRFRQRDVILGVWRVSRYIRASTMLQKSYQFSRLDSECPAV